MPIEKEQSIPPPMIGKIGYYTVFVTPTPKSSSEPSPLREAGSQKKNVSPIQPPPVQYEKSAMSYGSSFGFFWDAIAKLQNVHSSLDDYLAHWFGLNQSKYQWALDDYYENKDVEKFDTKAKDISTKAQIVLVKVAILVYVCNKRSNVKTTPLVADTRFIPLTMVKFLDDMEREKPIRFTSQQLRIATENFSIILGSGGFGTVYKGIFSNGTIVAVKVLNGTSDKRIEEQFMAEVSTMGRTHHFNLVRLYGFCFEQCLRALVYEFMVNGSLDNHLFKANKENVIGFEKLQEIALGTARGISYLHEECPHRIVHYDIKPGNILLDSKFCAKVADFGLAKLCNRDNTHITMTGGRGTPGYAAPELWMPLPVTHKCDVYSFGMLLFEILGRRRNMDVTLCDCQQWFPVWVWENYENKRLNDLMIVCAIEEKDREVVERMLKVALCCVQYRPETRPVMSIVVKMLEGALDVPEPLNPFAYLFSGVENPGGSLARMAWNGTGSDWSSSEVATRSTIVSGTPEEI